MVFFDESGQQRGDSGLYYTFMHQLFSRSRSWNTVVLATP